MSEKNYYGNSKDMSKEYINRVDNSMPKIINDNTVVDFNDMSEKVKIKDLKRLLNTYVNDEEGEIRIDAEDEFGIELDLKLVGFKQSVYNNNLILILKPR